MVFSLNNSGIRTERSCEGHEGSDWHYDFPWVVISFEKDLTKLEGIIDAYNSFVRPLRDLSLWEVSFNVEGLRYWLVPKEKQRTVVRLRKDSAYLAKFISKYSKTLLRCFNGLREAMSSLFLYISPLYIKMCYIN